MSQYPWQPPSPYQYPAGYGYDPYAAYLAPARRAGFLLIILGLLMFAGAFCCGVMSILPREQIEQQLQIMRQRSGQTITVSVETLQRDVAIVAALLAGTGISMIVLGIFVRKGSRGSTITAIVLIVLLIVIFVFMLLAGRAILWLVPLGMFILQMIWLIQALRAGTQLQMIQMQYQQQYWQHQQQQQMYGQQPPQAPPPQSPPPTDGGSHGPAQQ